MKIFNITQAQIFIKNGAIVTGCGLDCTDNLEESYKKLIDNKITKIIS